MKLAGLIHILTPTLRAVTKNTNLHTHRHTPKAQHAAKNTPLCITANFQSKENMEIEMCSAANDIPRHSYIWLCV